MAELSNEAALEHYNRAWQELNTLSTSDEITSADRIRVRAERDLLNAQYRDKVIGDIEARTNKFRAFVERMESFVKGLEDRDLGPRIAQVKAVVVQARGILDAAKGVIDT